MSARKSPTFSKPSPSNLRSPQGKIPASGSEGRKSGAQAEDGGFQPAGDLRLPIADCRFAQCPPLWRLTNTLVKTCRPEGRRYISVRNGELSLRNVKNEDRPGYMYENKGDNDKMSGEKTGFYTKMYRLREDRQQSVGLIGRNCPSHAIIRGEVAPLKSALSGWQVSGTAFWHSGIPFSVVSTPYSYGGNGIVQGSGPQFASVVPGTILFGSWKGLLSLSTSEEFAFCTLALQHSREARIGTVAEPREAESQGLSECAVVKALFAE